MHFGRQRLGILAASLDRTRPSHSIQHLARVSAFRHLPSPISLAHARKKEGVVSFDSAHMASSRASSSSSSASSRKHHSKVVHMLDIADPTCLRATLNRILQLPDLISLKKRSPISRKQSETPRLCRQTKYDSKLVSPTSRSWSTLPDSETGLFLGKSHEKGISSTKNTYSKFWPLSKPSKSDHTIQSNPLTLAANKQSLDYSAISTCIPPSLQGESVSGSLHFYSIDDPETPRHSVFANTPSHLFRRKEMFISDFDDSAPIELSFTSPTPCSNVFQPSILYNDISYSTNDLEGLMLTTHSTTLPDSVITSTFDIDYFPPVSPQPTILTNPPDEADTLNIRNDILSVEDPWKTIGDILGLPYAPSSDWLAASSLELWPNQVGRNGVGCPQSSEQVHSSEVFHHPSDASTLDTHRKVASSSFDFGFRDESGFSPVSHGASQDSPSRTNAHTESAGVPENNKRVLSEADNIQPAATPKDETKSTTFRPPAPNEMSPFTSIFSQVSPSAKESVTEPYDRSNFVTVHELDDKWAMPAAPEDVDVGLQDLSLPFPSLGTLTDANYSEYFDALGKDKIIIGPNLFATVDMGEYSE